jgi:hypothetical protein
VSRNCEKRPTCSSTSFARIGLSWNRRKRRKRSRPILPLCTWGHTPPRRHHTGIVSGQVWWRCRDNKEGPRLTDTTRSIGGSAQSDCLWRWDKKRPRSKSKCSKVCRAETTAAPQWRSLASKPECGRKAAVSTSRTQLAAGPSGSILPGPPSPRHGRSHRGTDIPCTTPLSPLRWCRYREHRHRNCDQDQLDNAFAVLCVWSTISTQH